MPTDTPDTSRAALEALADEAADRADTEAIPGGFDARVAATLRALAARVVELEAEVERLREVLLLIEREVDDNGDAEEALVEIGCLIIKALVDTGHARAALETPNAD